MTGGGDPRVLGAPRTDVGEAWRAPALRLADARLFSTHHASAADVLAGAERSVQAPAYALLVGRARRFTSLVTQLHLEVCGELHARAATPPIAVFATRHGEIQTAEALISDLRDAARVSSARFALSVHNTPSGLYSVATGSAAPTTTVTGGDAAAAGWLEAALTVAEEGQPVLLSVADEPVPEVFEDPQAQLGFAAAFLLGPRDAPGQLLELELAWGEPTDRGEPATPAEVLRALAELVDAVQRGRAATVELGQLAAGARVTVRLAAPSGAA